MAALYERARDAQRAADAHEDMEDPLQKVIIASSTGQLHAVGQAAVRTQYHTWLPLRAPGRWRRCAGGPGCRGSLFRRRRTQPPVRMRCCRGASPTAPSPSPRSSASAHTPSQTACTLALLLTAAASKHVPQASTGGHHL